MEPPFQGLRLFAGLTDFKPFFFRKKICNTCLTALQIFVFLWMVKNCHTKCFIRSSRSPGSMSMTGSSTMV